MKTIFSKQTKPVLGVKFTTGLAAIGAVALVLALGSASHSQAQETNAPANANATPSKPVPYPFDYCVVSGEKLGGDMGAPITYLYTTNGVTQEIKFCCPMCKPRFLKNPDKYMKLIQDAEAAAKK